VGVSSVVEALVDRLVESASGPSFVVDDSGRVMPAPVRETWIDFQAEVVAVAGEIDQRNRVDLARALLHAVLHQASYGPEDRLSADAFAFLLETVPDEVAASLDPSTPAHQYGGRRYLQRHLWAIPGREGTDWLLRLVRADPGRACVLYGDMWMGKLRMWVEDDWPDRIDALSGLASEMRTLPRPLPITGAPRIAAPALVRLALAHGVDERDVVVRHVADRLRSFHGQSPDEDVELVDWDARQSRPELFRWLLELMGADGDRPVLVAAARSANLVSGEDAAWLSEPLARPAWADGEVPWEIDEEVDVGTVSLPNGRLTGGDPWCAVEGLSWVLELPPGTYQARVVIAAHPLRGRECAALHLIVDPSAMVERWTHVPSARGDGNGYIVEVGVAGFGSTAVYEKSLIIDCPAATDFPGSHPPAWSTLDGGRDGSMVFCTVGAQHQTCRTWIGIGADGQPVALVTDLGLLRLDLTVDSALPWTAKPPTSAGDAT
jgi:hypothetical protein